MKPVLAWIKSNVLIVVFSALILLILPTAWFISSSWDASIRASQQKTADDAFKKLQALKLTYTLPSFEASGQPVSHSEVPNLQLIQWFKEQREVLSKQATAVVEKAERFNVGIGEDAQSVGRTEHTPLVEGVFPAGGQSKLDEMEDALLGNRGKQNPYRQLLASIRAGAAADAATLAGSLEDYRLREIEKITAGKRDLTPEEQETLRKQMTDRRIGEYQGAASSISVYASIESLPNDPKGSFVPSGANIDQDYINPADMFMFQWDYWVLRDIFAAVKLANTSSGKLVNVDRAVVKRIESISIDLPPGMQRAEDTSSSRGGDPSMMGGVDPNAVAAPGGIAPRDFNRSITGRMAPNGVYDAREVTLVAVVDSARLSEFLAAIERTNFMTVTDMDLADVKVWDDLQKGYFYGPNHVVRATLTIETVWLRSWMTKYMPPALKAKLNIVDPAAPTDPNAPAPDGGTG